MPGLTIGDTIPNLDVDTTHGRMKLHDYIGDSWAVLFSHPADFTPLCTTELGKMTLYAPEFEKRGVKLLGFSCHAVPSHLNWIGDIESYAPGCEVSYSYPIVADPTREVIRQLNMVDPEAKDADGAELPSRALHVVAGDKRIKLSIVYPATTGRDLDEVLRVVDSLQATAKYRVATPVNWRPGQPVVIFPSVTTEEAQKMFPRGYTTVDLPSKKEYLRLTKL